MDGVAARRVRTRSGRVFNVPAGISRNHGAGCWVVTWGKRDWTPRGFMAGGDARSLENAKVELARRQAIARERGDVPRADRVERRHKSVLFGRPGVRFQPSNTHCGYFVASVSHAGIPYKLRLRVDFDVDDFASLVEQQWRRAIAARDVMIEMIGRGQWPLVLKLRPNALPASIRGQARLLEISPRSVRAIVRHVERMRTV